MTDMHIGWAYNDGGDAWHLCRDAPRKSKGRVVQPVFLESQINSIRLCPECRVDRHKPSMSYTLTDDEVLLLRRGLSRIVLDPEDKEENDAARNLGMRLKTTYEIHRRPEWAEDL